MNASSFTRGTALALMVAGTLCLVACKPKTDTPADTSTTPSSSSPMPSTPAPSMMTPTTPAMGSPTTSGTDMGSPTAATGSTTTTR